MLDPDLAAYPPVFYGKRILWELPVQLCASDYLQPGDCVLDVGANIGGLSVAFSRLVGAQGRVCAIEANRFVLPRLYRDLEANHASNVLVISKAAWSTSGERRTLFCEDSYYGQNSGLIDKVVGVERDVETITLDEIYRDYRLEPDLVKIDVEGAEFEVLVGAREIIRDCSPVIVFEYTATVDAGRDAAEHLRGLGYALFEITSYKPVDRDFYLTHFASPPLVNLLALPARLQSAGSRVFLIPEGSVQPSDWLAMSGSILLRRTGRYRFGFDFDGPGKAVVGLRASDEKGETLAYIEAPVESLKAGDAACLVFEIEEVPAKVTCELLDAGELGEIRLGMVEAVRFARLPEDLKPDGFASEQFRECCQWVQSGRFVIAGKRLAEILEGDAENGEAHFLEAISLQIQSSDPERTLQHFASALHSGFDEALVLHCRGRLFYEIGEFARSVADLERAAALQPSRLDLGRDLDRALKSLIRQLIRDAIYVDAAPHLSNLLRRPQSDPEWYYLAGYCIHKRWACGDGSFEDLNRSLSLYDLALKQGFDEYWVRLRRGQLLLEMGKYEDALADAEQTLQLSPGDPMAKNLAADLAREMLALEESN